MGGAGMTSQATADDLFYSLNDANITQFTSNDILFLDCSVNDAVTFPSFVDNHKIASGMDALIRRIYHRSKEGSWPTVILLEMWPFPNNLNLGLTSSKGIGPGEGDYSIMYSQVGSKFKLPIWSLKDVVWSDFSISDPSQSKFLSFIQFRQNKFRRPDHDWVDNHPPFYVHIFYADFVASMLQAEFYKCATKLLDVGGIIVNGTVESSHADMLITSLPQDENVVSSNFTFCSSLHDPLISVSATHALSIKKTTANNKTTLPTFLVGTVESIPDNSWKLYKDRPGKPGWIFQLPSQTAEPATLVFHMNNSSHSQTLDLSGDFLLTVEYLRTYENAGIVEISLCGQMLATLDALWHDYESYKISINQQFHASFNNLRDMCGTSVTFKISHKASQKTNEKISRARGNEKFKVVKVRLCRIAK